MRVNKACSVHEAPFRRADLSWKRYEKKRAVLPRHRQKTEMDIPYVSDSNATTGSRSGMTTSIDTLETGDVVQIKYRVWRQAPLGGEDMVERWVTAHVSACEPGTWPLARLADGQATEIRPFMTWRLVASSSINRARAA